METGVTQKETLCWSVGREELFINKWNRITLGTGIRPDLKCVNLNNFTMRPSFNKVFFSNIS